MSSDADLHDQLVAIFGAEVSERVQAMNRHLLALEEDSDGAELDEQLAGLFREAHSLKGAAGAVGMTEVAAIAHRLESVFQAVRNGELTLQRSGFDVLYAAWTPSAPWSRPRARPRSTPPPWSLPWTAWPQAGPTR